MNKQAIRAIQKLRDHELGQQQGLLRKKQEVESFQRLRYEGSLTLLREAYNTSPPIHGAG